MNDEITGQIDLSRLNHTVRFETRTFIETAVKEGGIQYDALRDFYRVQELDYELEELVHPIKKVICLIGMCHFASIK